jgi:hypothetical protein
VLDATGGRRPLCDIRVMNFAATKWPFLSGINWNKKLSLGLYAAWSRPVRTCSRILDSHVGALRRPNRYRRHIKVVEAKDIDAKVIRGSSLAMENVNTALSAKVVLCSPRVPLVKRKQFLARDHSQCVFWNLGPSPHSV